MVEQFSEPPGAYPCDESLQIVKLAGTIPMRSDLIDRIGGFNLTYRAADFIDWTLRETGFSAGPQVTQQRRQNGRTR